MINIIRNVFSHYIKGKNKDQFGVSPLKHQNKIHSDDVGKANILIKQYCSVFSTEDSVLPQLKSKRVNLMNSIVVQCSGVLKQLRNIKPYKAAGPDQIPAKFLFEFAEEVAPALTLIYNKSLIESNIPADWRKAYVTPIYKPGKKDRSNPENYRTISLTSISCKILEHIIFSNTMKNLNQYNVITDVQHGFRNKRSCNTQLISTINDFSIA